MSTRERILVVDDEEGIRETLTGILEDEGYQVATADSVAAARRRIASEPYHLLLLDVWLPDGDGLDVLSEIRASRVFEGPVIVISGHGNIDSAVKAIRLGAYDFLEKPLSMSRVLLTVDHALEKSRMEGELQDLSQRLGHQDRLIGESPAMRELEDQLTTAAKSDSRILITGENGTGKELAARQVHRLSARGRRPFVAVNCAAIPDELIESELFGHTRGAFTGAVDDRRGRFEQADRGTLFLDEIGDMSMRTQAKVLRVLEDQRFERVGSTTPTHVDVRVLAATNKRLDEEIREERFREDLFFRLAVIPLHVPPLRDRHGDVPLLASHFLSQLAVEMGKPPKRLADDALERLQAYHWPGNVRELRNLMERLMIMAKGDTIEVADLPANVRGHTTGRFAKLLSMEHGSLKDAREAFERQLIEQKLAAHDGNVTRTAEVLGVERSHLHRKLKQYKIERPS